MRICNFIFGFIFWLLTPSVVIGQSCLPGGITFSTQAQINAFAANYPGCSQILGNVTINDAVNGNITNLNGLAAVRALADFCISIRTKMIGRFFFDKNHVFMY